MDICSLPVVAQVCAGSANTVASPIQALADMVGDLAAWVLEGVWALMVTTTMTDVTSTPFRRVYALVFGIAILVMLLFFLLQVITGMVRRDPGALGRGVLGLGKSILGSFLGVTLTAALLEITDQLCHGLVRAAGTTMEQVGERLILMVTGISISTMVVGVGPLLTLFLAGLAFTGAFTVWISLLVRSALILVAIALAPLALAGASWDATRGWVTKWATFTVALIVSKLVLVVIFLIATEQMSAPIEADIASVAEPLTGIVLLVIGAFAPYLTYKFLNFLGFDLYQTMTTETDAKEALNRPVPYLPGGWPRPTPAKVLGSDGTTDGGDDGAAAGGGGSASSTTTASSGTSVGGSTGATSVGSAAGTGAGSSAGAGAGASTSAGAAAAGPAAPVVAGAALAKAAFDAGPAAGRALGGQAAQTGDGATTPTADQPTPSGTPSGARGTPTASADAQPPSASPRERPGILFQDGE
ncbi:conjugal transfer protein TrbL [Promicromonospora sp. NPDC050249]|uniref:conjugal transfer protein TrbL n=1 Tax=Promicromonospora sp. NPDC050249 TaxID=3154743 RepID=UPI0033E21CEF